MFSTLTAEMLTLTLGFIIGWLAAWLIVVRPPGAPTNLLWKRVLLGAGTLAVILLVLVLSPLVDLSMATGAQSTEKAALAPTQTPYPTYTSYTIHTPYPTHTSYPSYTLLPTSTLAWTSTSTVPPAATRALAQPAAAVAAVVPTSQPTQTPATAAGGGSRPLPVYTPAAMGQTGALPTAGASPTRRIGLVVTLALIALLIGSGVWEARRQQ